MFSEPRAFSVGDAVVLAETEKAIKVDVSNIGEVWVPKSQVHDNSEVWTVGQEGLLVVTEWYAEKQGWA